MSGGSKQSGTQTVTQRTEIPAFLQPLVQQSAALTGRTLSQLEPTLASGDFVLPFSPFEQQAQQMMMERAAGAGGFIPTAQQQFLQTAQGMPLSSFIPESAMSGFNLDPTARQTLEQTAQGSFLHGGEGFNAALEAAQRAAMPGIFSTFGMAGAGAGRGGLAQTAMSQATADAFARLYGQERANQLGAASQLGQFGMQGASQLANLASQERSRQLAAAAALPEMAMIDPSIMGMVGQTQRQQQELMNQMPAMNLERLLAASQGTIPITSLFGQASSQPLYRNTGAGILGGAATGAGLGQALGLAGLGPLGAMAGIGGLLGGFL